jgi:hypothetical protein
VGDRIIFVLVKVAIVLLVAAVAVGAGVSSIQCRIFTLSHRARRHLQADIGHRWRRLPGLAPMRAYWRPAMTCCVEDDGIWSRLTANSGAY